jgi:hypothetical protein
VALFDPPVGSPRQSQGFISVIAHSRVRSHSMDRLCSRLGVCIPVEWTPAQRSIRSVIHQGVLPIRILPLIRIVAISILRPNQTAVDYHNQRGKAEQKLAHRQQHRLKTTLMANYNLKPFRYNSRQREVTTILFTTRQPTWGLQTLIH